MKPNIAAYALVVIVHHFVSLMSPWSDGEQHINGVPHGDTNPASKRGGELLLRADAFVGGCTWCGCDVEEGRGRSCGGWVSWGASHCIVCEVWCRYTGGE